MSLRVKRSEWFVADLEHYADYYTTRAGWDLAARYLSAVNSTLSHLSEVPSLGHLTHFKSAELRGLRCMSVEKPSKSIWYSTGTIKQRCLLNALFMVRAICRGGCFSRQDRVDSVNW
jgi:hypothetical protein